VDAVSDIDVLRDLYSAFNDRDIERLLEAFDPWIEIEPTEDLEYAALLLRVLGPRFVILSGGYRGLDEVRRLFESVWQISDWFRVEPEDYVAVADRVVVPLRLQARAEATGIEGEAVTAHLWKMRDGKAVRLQVYASRSDAIAAAKRQQAEE
jgi:ketosteroid isomerase-like protein